MELLGRAFTLPTERTGAPHLCGGSRLNVIFPSEGETAFGEAVAHGDRNGWPLD